MRRPALYLAGLFLATGASLALAAPASAAGTHCKKNHGSAASIHSYGHAYAYDDEPDVIVVRDRGRDWDDDWNGGIGNTTSNSRVSQLGLLNVNVGPFTGGGFGW
ncbi:hypothetical protein GCM10010168_32470 [Actinoplanes ianthinogenes]|uniref:Uncharacterized protein n=1 Tax=Actinoplanes ianthinogenes TaxID=122358 RepID=A0ABM7LM94_9ACTN|nr:hypothetical protein [Actinoplanes ianthinogenes]BCJ40387.1 hypothetical protein Aiant_10440 [Actinoplanes ianthinogenes]GGR11873.1 hypothetical protein GCM10010168_32470 [Actinoplanes ianthinogenes]